MVRSSTILEANSDLHLYGIIIAFVLHCIPVGLINRPARKRISSIALPVGEDVFSPVYKERPIFAIARTVKGATGTLS